MCVCVCVCVCVVVVVVVVVYVIVFWRFLWGFYVQAHFPPGLAAKISDKACQLGRQRRRKNHSFVQVNFNAISIKT